MTSLPKTGQKVTINVGARKGREAIVLAVYEEDDAVFCQVKLKTNRFSASVKVDYRVDFLVW